MRSIHNYRHKLNKKTVTWLGFLLPLVFFLVADSIASYVFPVFTERIVNSNTLLGIIITANTLTAILADFTLSKVLNGKHWSVSFYLALFTSIAFTVLMYFAITTQMIWLLVLASIAMGIYLESIMFSIQEFIPHFDVKANFTKDWNVIWGTWGIGSIVGPIVGSFFVSISIIYATTSLLILQLFSLLLITLFIFKIAAKSKINHSTSIGESSHTLKISFTTQLKLWRAIIVKAWPPIFLSFVFAFIDATFWSLAGVFGEEQFSAIGLGWLLVFAYGVTDITTALIFGRLNISTRKKRTSQLVLIVGSALLIAIPFVYTKPIAALVCIVAAGILLNGANLLNLAVFSDLQDRDIKISSIISGLQRISYSFGFILAPVTGGLISDAHGYSFAFATAGAAGIVVATFLLFFTPKKIHLPQHRIDELLG